MKFVSSLVVLVLYSTFLSDTAIYSLAAETSNAFESTTTSKDRSDEDAVVPHRTARSIVLPWSKRASPSSTSSSLPLYYIHHVVPLTSNANRHGKVVPVNLPKLGDYPELPQEEWTEFWTSKVRPIAAKMERSRILDRNIGWAIVLVYLFETIGTWKQHKGNMNVIARMNSASLRHSGSFHAMILATIARQIWSSNARKTQLDSLMNVCHEQGELLFQKHGYTVECSCDVLERFGGHALSLDFYRIDSDNALAEEKSHESDDSKGPLRVKLCSLGSSALSCVSIVNMPVLQAHIPTIKFSTDMKLHDLWSSFWHELKATSNQVMQRHQLATYVNYGLLFSVTFHAMLRNVARSVWSKVNTQFLSSPLLKLAAFHSLQIIPIDLLLYVVGCIFAADRYSHVLNTQRNLVGRYAPEFAKYNVLLEHRRKATFGRSIDYVDYLYLVPSMGNGINATEDRQ